MDLMYFAPQHTTCMCTPSAALSRLHTSMHCTTVTHLAKLMEIFSSFHSAQHTEPTCVSFLCLNVCRYMHVICLWVFYSSFFPGSTQQEAAKPPSPLPPSHPTTIPNGFKHPDQLKERGVHRGPPPTSVREGKQEGLHSWAVQGNNITPSVTNRFIPDGMKYSSQIHLPRSSMCISLLCLKPLPIPRSSGFFISDYLPPTSQHPHLANYAFKSSST